MTAVKIIALVVIAFAVIACIGFVGIAGSTMGGPKGNAFFFGGLASILCVIAATAFLINRLVA